MNQPTTQQQLDLDAIEAVVRNAAQLGADIDPATAAALVAEVRRLRARVTQLEEAGTYARSVLAAFCCDLEDPGSNAFGALYEISRATTGVEAPRDDAAQALARHDAQVMRRCAEFVRDTYSGEWADDAAATLERDADITERGCPGFEKEYQGVSDAKRRLANCKHCGKPRTTHRAAPAARSDAAEESHVVADDSDDPEHIDDCPGCQNFTLTGHTAAPAAAGSAAANEDGQQ